MSFRERSRTRPRAPLFRGVSATNGKRFPYSCPANIEGVNGSGKVRAAAGFSRRATLWRSRKLPGERVFFGDRPLGRRLIGVRDAPSAPRAAGWRACLRGPRWKRSHGSAPIPPSRPPPWATPPTGPRSSAPSSPPPTATGWRRMWSWVGGGRAGGHGWRPARPPGPGFLRGPHPPQRLHPGMRVVREEIFGPVVAVVPFDDEEEGVALANDSDYGLIDYVWSGDVARAFRVARRLRAGPASTRSGGTWRPRSAGSRRAGWGGTWARTPCTPTARHRRSSGPDEPVAEQRGKILNPPKTDRATVTVRRHARLSGMHCKVSCECDLALMKYFGGVGCGIQG